MRNPAIKTALAIAALTTSLAAYAVPTLIVTDGVVSSGPITDPSGSVMYINPAFGDSWRVVITTATTKPLFGSAGSPNMELDIQATATGASPIHDLTVIFSDTDFGPTSGRFSALMTGHVIGDVGGGTVTFDTYYDAGNNVAAVTSPLTASGGVPGPTYDFLDQGGAIVGVPFSLTEVVTISGAPAASYSLGANLQSLSLACAGGSGQVGAPYTSTLVVNGGCAPYTFSIISGSLPPGLTLNPHTGDIIGIPTQPGSFPYVAQVTDCAHRTADTANESCVITIGSCNGQIGDFVWNDVNGNGCQDAGEHGIPGVQVSLFSGACGTSGTLVATTTTDNTGHYLFVGLCPGDYQVAITTPGGFTATTPNQGCKDNGQPPFTADRDSKCNCAGASPCITCVTLTAANPVNLNVDCGYVCNGQIGDFVWFDANANGCQDAGEPGIPGVKVDLFSGVCGGAVTHVATTTTDNSGHYLFSGLCPGNYQVAITTPAGLVATIPNTGCKDNTQPSYTADRDSKCDCGGGSPCVTCVTLTTGNPVDLNVDCGYVCNGQIGDFVWNDVNGNGCQDAGEPGIDNVQVNLYPGCGVSGTPFQSTTTKNGGRYLFSGLCPGTYTVSFSTPAGYTHTIAHAGCANNGNPPESNQTDSKCDCTSGETSYVISETLGAPRNDFSGYVGMTITVGADPVTVTQLGRIMVSGNSDTHIVKLVNASDGTDVAGGSVSLSMIGGTPGQFKYATLSSPVVLAAGATYYLVTLETAGGDEWYDVNGTTVATMTVAAEIGGVYFLGSWVPVVPFPDHTYGPVDFKYESNSTPAGTPCGVCVTLTPAAPIDLNVDCGYVCNGQIGDFVWSDTNGNGCQDAGEPGIPNVRVDLFSGACGVPGTLIATTFTDNTGHYLFSGLCAGAYQVAITTPAGFTATTPNKNCKDTTQPPFTADRDSKCNCAGASPCITCVTLTPANPVNLNVDCGYVCNGQIGDFVWSDLNGNGCQDVGEPGIPNVQVTLWTGACGSGGNQVATTLTDSTGHYLFSGLCAGDYFVSFTTPAGSTATKAHQACALNGTDNTRNQTDSKCDCSGASPCCIPVSLTPANPVNLNIDCGYVCNGQIGDYVWSDTNGNGCQDAGEPGIVNVRVDLFNGACGVPGTLIATTFTDNTGHYLFNGLCPGAYQVAITTPVGMTATTPNNGCKDTNQPPFTADRDSKCNCAGASPCITCVTLTTANPVNLNVDCGYIPQSPSLTLSKSADKSFVLPGGVVTYTYVVKNTGGITITNVTVVDDNGTPGFTADDVTVGTIASLAPGASQTFTFTDTLPQTECETINGTNVVVGLVLTTILPSGDIKVTYIQQAVNDNRYGTGATAATGWPSGHTFNNLVGSDKCEFRFTDGKGNVVFDFFCDYITASAAFPSGYGCLGLSGGDGSLVSGSAPNLLSATTSLSDSLNKPQFQSGFLVNSPPETSPNSGISVPAGWDYINSYTVVVSKNAFGANGFGGVSFPLIHDSPPKLGSNNAVTPTNCNSCVVNVAVVTGKAGTVTLTARATAQVCFGTPPPPSIIMSKTADKTVIDPVGDTVTYTYTVMNTGGQTVNNISVVDDNGTPGNPGDDFLVGTIASLAPGASATLTATRFVVQPQQPITMCETINGTNVIVGLVTTTVLASGDIKVTYLQQAVNDNRYGTGATAATGWASGHTFNNLVGSDKCEFRFTDGKGNVVFDFFCDYITASAGFPSGYGCLGLSGGDGSLVSGNAANLLSATTSLSDNFNKNSSFKTGFFVNSPPETSPNSGISVPAGWDYNNSYTVVVSKNAFGANGFGGVSFPLIHDSPAKLGGNAVTPTNCNSCLVNIATAVGSAGATAVSASASAQVCFATPPPPSMTLIKTADKTVIDPIGDTVTYTYTVMNTGGRTIANIAVTDDNGTPGNTADDFVVGTIASLAPGASATLTATRNLVPSQQQPITMCETINGTNVVVGLVTTTVLGSGDIQVTYLQQAVNDNRYGTGATAATGWPSGHTFNNLVGSDKCEFRFTDSKGNVVLDFFCDYITASSAFPSGYGCLGLSGGDGSLVSGNAANLLSATTSLSDNFNKAGSPFKTGYFVNSPPETFPNLGISVPAGWDYNNSYTVVVSKNAFGANGFGGVSFPLIHDSPAKLGGNAVTPTNCNSCVVNIATAVGSAGATSLSASASAQVCFGTPAGSQTCNITAGAVGVGSSDIHIPLKNNGTTNIYLTEVTLSWPAANGQLKKVSLNGDIWGGPAASSPVDLGTADFNAFNIDITHRMIAPGQTKTLQFTFSKPASKDTTQYSGTVKFGTDASCVLTFP